MKHSIESLYKIFCKKGVPVVYSEKEHEKYGYSLKQATVGGIFVVSAVIHYLKNHPWCEIRDTYKLIVLAENLYLERIRIFDDFFETGNIEYD